MVHDITPYDCWYHDLINELAKAKMDIYLSQRYVDDGECGVEVSLLLQKAICHMEKANVMLRGDYIERKRKGE